MTYAAAFIYWVIVGLWAMVLASVVYSYCRNPRTFGTTRLLLIVIGIDTFRNIFENVYFGLYFGGQYGVFPSWLVSSLGQPVLLIIPKLMNIGAGCLVLGLLLYRWLPLATDEWDQSERRADDLRMLASIDPLTGIYNRTQFEEMARAELARCQRYMRPLSVLVLDIDHFKDINDRLGHEVGDWILKMMAKTLGLAKREVDVVARVGADEFAFLLPETTKDSAAEFAERVCALIRKNAWSIAGHQLQLTASIGVANATIRMSGIEALLRAADNALREAKQGGGDCAKIANSLIERVSLAAE